jgi:hypothetical protein
MNAEELARAVKAQPFVPFRLHMSDGRTFDVSHPELLVVFPGMRRLAVLAFPKEEAVELIDLLHVTSLSSPGRNGKRGRRRERSRRRPR